MLKKSFVLPISVAALVSAAPLTAFADNNPDVKTSNQQAQAQKQEKKSAAKAPLHTKTPAAKTDPAKTSLQTKAPSTNKTTSTEEKETQQPVLNSLVIDSAVKAFSSLQASSSLMNANGSINLNGDIKIGDEQLHPVYKFDLANNGPETLSSLNVTIPFPEGYELDKSFAQLVLITPNNNNPFLENISFKIMEGNNGLTLSIPDIKAGERMNFDVKFFLMKPKTELVITKEMKEKFKLAGNGWFMFKGKNAEFTHDLFIENGNETSFKDFSLYFKAPEFFKFEKYIWVNGIKVSLVQTADGNCMIKIPEVLKGKTHLKLKLSGMVNGTVKAFSMPFTLLCGKELIMQKPLGVSVKDNSIPDFTKEMKQKIKLNGNAWFMQKGNKAEFYHELLIENGNTMSFKHFNLCFNTPASLKLEKYIWINGVKASLIQNANGTCTVTLPEVLKGKTHLELKLSGTVKGKIKSFSMPISLQTLKESICEKSISVNMKNRVNPAFTKEMKHKMKLHGKAWLKVKGKKAEFSPEFWIENANSMSFKNVCLCFKAPSSFKIENVIWLGGMKGTITQRADGIYQILLPQLPKGKAHLKLKITGMINGEIKPITFPLFLESDNETVIEQPFTVPLNNSGNPAGGVDPGTGGSADPGSSGGGSVDPGTSTGGSADPGTSGNNAATPVSTNPSMGRSSTGNTEAVSLSTLPITGSAFDSNMFRLLGIAAAGAGIYLFRRKGVKN